MKEHAILGIDVGGTNIKGAVVDSRSGEFLSEKISLPTQPNDPEGIARQFKQIVDRLEWDGLIGCGFPAVIRQGVALTAANVDKSWIGINAKQLFRDVSGCKVYVVNDADAAGMAEMTLGAGKTHRRGSILMLTIGTGIGSAFFNSGHLVPNTELGHLHFNDSRDIETEISGSAITRKGLSLKDWAHTFNQYLQYVNMLLRPDLFILGGGVCNSFHEFKDWLQLDVPIIQAEFHNDAGIIGAAMFADYKGKAI
jgi:polyphosphate glucokinase